MTISISSRAKRKMGGCKFVNGEPCTIRLSEWILTGEVPWEIVEDTIRHEVAHAVAGLKAGHGKEWKAAARRLGANPNRVNTDRRMLSALPKHKWALVCPEHGVLARRHRRRKRQDVVLVCAQCKRKGRRTIPTWKENRK